jgi:hypothetical protein
LVARFCFYTSAFLAFSVKNPFKEKKDKNKNQNRKKPNKKIKICLDTKQQKKKLPKKNLNFYNYSHQNILFFSHLWESIFHVKFTNILKIPSPF